MTEALQLRPVGSHALDIAAANKTLARYTWDPTQPHAYVHPLRSYHAVPALTNHAPFDHRWHHGLWWSWKTINGIVFWEDQDPDNEGTSRVTDHAAQTLADGSIEIRQSLAMRTNRDGALLMTEQRVITARAAVPGADVPGGWALDWDMIHTAKVDCEMDVTPYPEVGYGGYMGMSYRATRSMGWGECIINSEDGVNRDDCHGHSARWCAYGGNLDEHEDRLPENPAQAGVAILDHPENLRHPTPFYTWSTGEDNRGFGFLAASIAMHEPVTLRAGASLRLCYRVVPFDGPPPREALDAAWQAFAITPSRQTGTTA